MTINARAAASEELCSNTVSVEGLPSERILNSSAAIPSDARCMTVWSIGWTRRERLRVFRL